MVVASPEDIGLALINERMATLDRQFDVEAAEKAWLTDITYSAPRPNRGGI